MNPPGKQAFLLGSNKLQLELMSDFITERANIPCAIVPALNEIPCCSETKHLVLYDFKNWKSDVKDDFESGLKNHLSNNFVVLINMVNTMGSESEALSYGVRGFLYEQDGMDILLKMIHAVFSSELWVSRNVMTEYIQTNNRRILHHDNTPLGLTSREIEILSAITLGRSNDRIAEKLCISPHTVKTHVYHIFKKINVSSRLQAANWSSQHL
jgi:DNA-binding NarL/FixJ family response regulator